MQSLNIGNAPHCHRGNICNFLVDSAPRRHGDQVPSASVAAIP